MWKDVLRHKHSNRTYGDRAPFSCERYLSPQYVQTRASRTPDRVLYGLSTRNIPTHLIFSADLLRVSPFFSRFSMPNIQEPDGSRYAVTTAHLPATAGSYLYGRRGAYPGCADGARNAACSRSYRSSCSGSISGLGLRDETGGFRATTPRRETARHTDAGPPHPLVLVGIRADAVAYRQLPAGRTLPWQPNAAA